MAPAAALRSGERDADEALADLVHRALASAGPRADAVADRRPPMTLAADALRLPRRRARAEDLGRVHFLAIGGAGMSGVARIMLARGMPVTRHRRPGVTLLHALAAEGAAV